VPSLDEIARDPARAAELSATGATDLLGVCESEITRYQRVRDLLLIRAAVASNSGPEHGDNGRLLDSFEAAARLGVPETWVRAMARQRKLPSVRLGHYIRFRPADLDDFVATHPR
jgi:excisionase family DNA binding protein